MKFLASISFPLTSGTLLLCWGGLGVPPVLFLKAHKSYPSCSYFPSLPFAALALVNCVRLTGGTDQTHSSPTARAQPRPSQWSDMRALLVPLACSFQPCISWIGWHVPELENASRVQASRKIIRNQLAAHFRWCQCDSEEMS